MTQSSCDVLVIGGGPGGYTAALLAAKGGADTVLVERDRVGGTCLLRGCIPTKALVETSRLIHRLSTAQDHGLSVDLAGVDWSKALARKNAVVDRLRKGVEFLLKKNKVRLVQGTGCLTGPGIVEVDGQDRWKADHVILAAGSEPMVFPDLETDGRAVLNSDHILDLEDIPSSLAVVGGGVIGCEFASIFALLGTKVTIIELEGSILPTADALVVKEVGRAFKKRKVQIRTSEKIERLDRSEEGVTIHLGSGDAVSCEKVLVSIGRRAASAGLVAPALSLADGKGWISTDDHCRTPMEGVWAVGDLIGQPMLAHWAAHQASVAVANIRGGDRAVDSGSVPFCVFTTPEAAWVGITEERARAEGRKIKTGAFPFRALGRAVASGEIDGTVKLVAEEESGRLVGFHAVGPHVTDLCAQAALAIRLGVTAEELEHTIHAHPTYPEALCEAAADVYGMAVHI